MKFFLILFLLFASIESYSQNIKKLLDEKELDSLSKGFEIFKFTNRSEVWDNFQGIIRIKSINKKFIYCTIGEWQKYDEAHKKLLAYFKYDSLGCMEIYKEFTESGFNEYDCIYVKREINGKLYLIETIKYYYDNGQICEIGQRVKGIDYRNGYVNYLGRFKKIGTWKRYNYDGSIDYEKQHKELKKE